MTHPEVVDVVEKLCAVAHAHEDRIKTLEDALAARERVDLESASERIVRLLDWLPGVPLTSDDVAEVLGITVSYARQALQGLADAGRVRRWRDPESVNTPRWLFAGREDVEAAA